MNSHTKNKNGRRRSYWWLSVLLVLAVFFAACQEEAEPTATLVPTVEPPQATPEPEPTVPPTEEVIVIDPMETSDTSQMEALLDELWVLVAYGDALNPDVIEPGAVITAVFGEDGTLSGQSTCNNYSAGYSMDADGTISIGPIASTRMACEEMDVEQAYFAALETAQKFQVTDEGRLELAYDSGAVFDEKLVYAAGETPLENTAWLLVGFDYLGQPGDLVNGTTITALFTPESEGANHGAVSGVATCNNYSLGYTITEDGGLTTMPGRMTLMACPWAAEQEGAYMAALGTAESYQIVGTQLDITYEDGVLHYTSLNLPLENTLWRATFLNNQPVAEEVEITALFVQEEEAGQGRVTGVAACNNYTGGYTVDGENITFSEGFGTTRMFCEEPLNELESEYLGTLQGAETYEILGDQLRINSSDGNILYEADRQPLQGTLWELVALGSIDAPQEPIEGSNFTAVFEKQANAPSGIMFGSTGCNDYNATYAANLDEIKINLPSKGKNEECPWGTGNFEVEQQYFLGLNSADSYTILGNELIIFGNDGQQAFHYRGRPLEVEETLDLTPLDGTFWYLVDLSGQALIPGSEITAQFEINDDGVTGQVGGSAGCNNYSGGISENFVIGPLATTQKFCSAPAGLMEQEQTYLATLQTANDYAIAGDSLLINTPTGVLGYSSTQPESTVDQTLELQNITWYLLSYEQLTPVPGAEPTAFFGTDNTVSGSTGCNDYSGAYRTEPGNKLTVSGIVKTLAACTTENLTRQDDAFTILMQSSVNYLVAGDQLSIVTVDGGVMNFTLVPPVGPTGPTAVINSPDGANVGDIVNFDGSGSQAGTSPIVSYNWDFGDGGLGTGSIVQYAYHSAGTYNVSLTVVDELGLSNTAVKPITINAVADTPPTAAITGPAAVVVNQQATYSAATSTAGSSPITRYIWNFGNGNTFETTEPTATTVFQTSGVFWVNVTVVDANGLSGSAGMQTTANASVAGVEWVLANTIPGTSITLQFTNELISGFGGCNTYNASIVIEDPNAGAYRLGPINSTSMACSTEISTQEQNYFAVLGATTRLSINGSQLTLTAPDGRSLLYNGRPLATPYQ